MGCFLAWGDYLCVNNSACCVAQYIHPMSYRVIIYCRGCDSVFPQHCHWVLAPSVSRSEACSGVAAVGHWPGLPTGAGHSTTAWRGGGGEGGNGSGSLPFVMKHLCLSGRRPPVWPSGTVSRRDEPPLPSGDASLVPVWTLPI